MNPDPKSTADDIGKSTEITTRLYSEKADELLSRYAALWLWSIILGTTSGLLWSSYYFRAEQYGHNTLLFLTPAFASLAFSIRSLLALRSMLFNYLLPEFFATDDKKLRNIHSSILEVRKSNRKSIDAMDGDGHSADSGLRHLAQTRAGNFSKNTRIAVNSVIFAVIFRILVDVLWMAFGAASHI
jgi:hypothetical protein